MFLVDPLEMLYAPVTYSLSSCIIILNLKHIPSRSALLTLTHLNILVTYSEIKLSHENSQSSILVHDFPYKGKRMRIVLVFCCLKINTKHSNLLYK